MEERKYTKKEKKKRKEDESTNYSANIFGYTDGEEASWTI